MDDAGSVLGENVQTKTWCGKNSEDDIAEQRATTKYCDRRAVAGRRISRLPGRIAAASAAAVSKRRACAESKTDRQQSAEPRRPSHRCAAVAMTAASAAAAAATPSRMGGAVVASANGDWLSLKPLAPARGSLYGGDGWTATLGPRSVFQWQCSCSRRVAIQSPVDKSR